MTGGRFHFIPDPPNNMAVGGTTFLAVGGSNARSHRRR
jgi:hypothetical protein